MSILSTPVLNLFWSYAHSDDDADGGRLVQLATDVAGEYRTITGEDVELFVDRKSIKWGDTWRQKVNDALTASTFLVAAVSPTYFKRPECRREMVEFHRQAESRGLPKLMLPLYYASVPEFDESNPDELISLASRSQYENWTDLRFHDRKSETYRRAVNQMVVRLIDLITSMRSTEISTQADLADSSDPVEFGFVEALDAIDSRLPVWRALIEADPVTRAQYSAVNAVYFRRLNNAPRSAQISLLHRKAQDLLPLTEQAVEAAKRYSSATIDLAPYVTAALRSARVSQAAAVALRDFREMVDYAHHQILGGDGEIVKEADADIVPSTRYWAHYAGLGGIFARMNELHTESKRYRSEANEIVEEWHRELNEIFSQLEEATASEVTTWDGSVGGADAAPTE